MGNLEPIGFVIALPLECRSLSRQRVKRLDTLKLNSNQWIRISGAGPTNAEAAADELLACGARRLVSWGCAGALADHLIPGSVVVPASVHDADGTVRRFSDDWRTRLEQALADTVTVESGPIVESATVVASPAAKRRLKGDNGQAVAVDMESAAVLRAAARHQVPCVAVRAIADDQSTSMPHTVLRSLDEHGEARVLRLLLELARRPSDLFALLHLNRCFHAAMNSLARVADSAGPSLAA